MILVFEALSLTLNTVQRARRSPSPSSVGRLQPESSGHRRNGGVLQSSLAPEPPCTSPPALSLLGKLRHGAAKGQFARHGHHSKWNVVLVLPGGTWKRCFSVLFQALRWLPKQCRALTFLPFKAPKGAAVCLWLEPAAPWVPKPPDHPIRLIFNID